MDISTQRNAYTRTCKRFKIGAVWQYPFEILQGVIRPLIAYPRFRGGKLSPFSALEASQWKAPYILDFFPDLDSLQYHHRARQLTVHDRRHSLTRTQMTFLDQIIVLQCSIERDQLYNCMSPFFRMMAFQISRFSTTTANQNESLSTNH